jgi:hypothetical protein
MGHDSGAVGPLPSRCGVEGWQAAANGEMHSQLSSCAEVDACNCSCVDAACPVRNCLRGCLSKGVGFKSTRGQSHQQLLHRTAYRLGVAGRQLREQVSLCTGKKGEERAEHSLDR